MIQHALHGSDRTRLAFNKTLDQEMGKDSWTIWMGRQADRQAFRQIGRTDGNMIGRKSWYNGFADKGLIKARLLPQV